jgi:hypothetical protein
MEARLAFLSLGRQAEPGRLIFPQKLTAATIRTPSAAFAVRREQVCCELVYRNIGWVTS